VLTPLSQRRFDLLSDQRTVEGTQVRARATLEEASGRIAQSEQRREKLSVQPQERATTGEAPGATAGDWRATTGEAPGATAATADDWRATTGEAPGATAAAADRRNGNRTSLMHEERAMGSSNGNVAVAELKYKPMQSRCEAAQLSTPGYCMCRLPRD
jgi:hypothetical protein